MFSECFSDGFDSLYGCSEIAVQRRRMQARRDAHRVSPNGEKEPTTRGLVYLERSQS
jgi:hypothetical protein